MARPTVVLNQCQLRNRFQRDNIGKRLRVHNTH
jgi:hypothetical protein